jgi:hypothetical protein
VSCRTTFGPAPCECRKRSAVDAQEPALGRKEASHVTPRRRSQRTRTREEVRRGERFRFAPCQRACAGHRPARSRLVPCSSGRSHRHESTRVGCFGRRPFLGITQPSRQISPFHAAGGLCARAVVGRARAAPAGTTGAPHPWMQGAVTATGQVAGVKTNTAVQLPGLDTEPPSTTKLSDLIILGLRMFESRR